MRHVLLSCLLLFSWTGSTWARDLYVNNRVGDDSNDGLSETGSDGFGPVRTVQRALQIARRCDTIRLANTKLPYRECISLCVGNQCGNETQPLTIDGQGATLDGSRAVPRSAWETWRGGIFRFRPERISFQQLYLEGQPVQRRRVETTYVDKQGNQATTWIDAPPSTLATREWCLRDGYLYFHVDQEMLPFEYSLAYAHHPVGITLDQVHDVVIRDLTVQGFRLDGIHAHDGVRRCELISVTCRANGRSGVTVAGDSNVAILESDLKENATAQLRVDELSFVEVIATKFDDKSAPAIEQNGGRIEVDGELREPVP